MSTVESVECHSPCSGIAEWNERAGVFVCRKCGRIGDHEALSTTTRNETLFTGGQEEDYIRFVGTITTYPSTYHIGPWVVIKSPYEAKAAIKSLDEDTTGRLWDSDISCWLIKESAKQVAKKQLNNTKYDVIDFTTDD